MVSSAIASVLIRLAVEKYLLCKLADGLNWLGRAMQLHASYELQQMRMARPSRARTSQLVRVVDTPWTIMFVYIN